MDATSMTACVAAVLGYGCVYAAAPSRSTLRLRTRVQTAGLLTIGSVLLLASALAGASAFSPVLGLLVTLAAAMTGGSTLILVTPWLSPRVRRGRRTRAS